MPECPPSGVSENAAGERPQDLTAEQIDALLADFRGWIERAAEAGELPADEPDAEPLDLHTLLGQFTALRHEVNLQTKAVRTQQEQNSATLQQYGEALERLRDAEAQALDDLLRPWLKNLLDAQDALQLARGQVERMGETVLAPLALFTVPSEPLPELPAEPDLEPEPAAGSPYHPPHPGFLGRLLGRASAAPEVVVDDRWQRRAVQLGAWTETLKAELAKVRRAAQVQAEQREEHAAAADRVRQLIDSVLTGYTMSVQRLERALQQCELEPIPCVGEPFDPELMEVVDVAADTDRPANEVVEEVRRGYLWRGRVFRYAQVRVAR